MPLLCWLLPLRLPCCTYSSIQPSIHHQYRSYRCACPRGFRLDLKGSRCLDRDECADGCCQSPCRNYAGSYRCDCPAGKYTFRPPPSSTYSSIQPSIHHQYRSYRCVCPRGFRLDLEGSRCLDRDECADGRCQSPCRNYAGSYRCDCPAGKCTFRPPPSSTYSSIQPSIHHQYRSYRCVCPRGFRLDLEGSRCLDRDECADGRCQSPCRNYAGSYRCDCPAGKCTFRPPPSSTYSSIQPSIHHQYRSYRCVCPRGFHLDLEG
ncbi:latent-transforming growth factor beta-binding protein 4-like [Cydia amplana]|uniref:latent-transforming growth factor beta-binding protein 4-like n=1 Tax=Cydia amplana TaxID=1869771 RepID=UPI002FE53A80